MTSSGTSLANRHMSARKSILISCRTPVTIALRHHLGAGDTYVCLWQMSGAVTPSLPRPRPATTGRARGRAHGTTKLRPETEVARRRTSVHLLGDGLATNGGGGKMNGPFLRLKWRTAHKSMSQVSAGFHPCRGPCRHPKRRPVAAHGVRCAAFDQRSSGGSLGFGCNLHRPSPCSP